MKTTKLFIFLSIVLLTFSACFRPQNNLDDFEYTKKTIKYKSIPNVDENLLSLDVYYSKNHRNLHQGVVIWVHGGGWAIGDKANNIEQKKLFFKKLHYVFVSVNYRLSPYPYEINNVNRIKFPLHPIDVADAVKWVYNHIDEYGGGKNRIVLFGHSAGAHLVALLGTDRSYLANIGVPPIIKGVAAIDTKMYDVYNEIQNNPNVNDLYINAFGTDPQENTKASPIRNISINSITTNQFFIVKRGSASRILAADNFVSSLSSIGVDVQVVEASQYNHTEVNTAVTDMNDTTISKLFEDFLVSHIGY